jgi:hypothetical protein
LFVTKEKEERKGSEEREKEREKEGWKAHTPTLVTENV